MKRLVFAGAIALGLWLSQGTASAQGLEYKPIDTNKLVVQPTDATTGILAGTTRYISRAVASTVEDNAFVRTINNLLGRKPTPTQKYQPGYSQIPLPGSYPSTGYRNSFMPQMPTQMQYGQSVPVRR